jgi:hypothetical protein
MAKAAPRSYGEAIVAAQAMVRTARLADPDEHFPYKYAEVTDLVNENPPMGLNGPDDDGFRAEDYMSQEIADATGSYVAAQAAYLESPDDATREEYEAAKHDLVFARQSHRVNRSQTGPIQRARRAGE